MKKDLQASRCQERMAMDIGRVTAVKDNDGTLLTGDDEIIKDS